MDRSTEFTFLVENCLSKQPQHFCIAKQDILQNTFNKLARTLYENIAELQKLIDELKPEIANINIILQRPKQVEVLRQDRSDHEIQKCIENCHKLIVEYMNLLNTTEMNSPQVKLYFSNTLYLVEQKLGQQIDSYTKMRSKRYERMQIVKKSFSLLSHLNGTESLDGKLEAPLQNKSKKYHKSAESSTWNSHDPSARCRTTHSPYINTLSVNSLELSDKDELVLKRENQQLVHEIKTEFDEINSIQTKLHEISQLQLIFAEEVLKQKEEVEIIASMTADSAVNIAEGNKQIRRAIKKQFTSDGIVLFIIVMFTIALWFLDWYQD